MNKLSIERLSDFERDPSNNFLTRSEMMDVVKELIAIREALKGEQVPVAFTGSGSLAAIKGGHEGHIWGTPADAHPVPLYDRPQKPTPEQLIEWLEGMEVSVDVSTCDADHGNRLFGKVTEVSELEGAKNGVILLVQEPDANFTAPQKPIVLLPPAYEKSADFTEYHQGWNACRNYMLEEAKEAGGIVKDGE